MAEKKKNPEFTFYKGKPVNRCGNILYVGDTDQPCFSMLQIINTQVLEDVELPQKVAVQLISNDSSLSPKDRVLKRAMKDGLYNAIDIASIWLDQYQQEHGKMQ